MMIDFKREDDRQSRKDRQCEAKHHLNLKTLAELVDLKRCRNRQIDKTLTEKPLVVIFIGNIHINGRFEMPPNGDRHQ